MKSVKTIIEYEEELIGDETLIIIPLRNGVADYKKCVLMEGTSYYIWNLIKNRLTEAEIAKEMEKKYHIDDGVNVKKDVIEFLNQLQETGLIDVGE